MSAHWLEVSWSRLGSAGFGSRLQVRSSSVPRVSRPPVCAECMWYVPFKAERSTTGKAYVKPLLMSLLFISLVHISHTVKSKVNGQRSSPPPTRPWQGYICRCIIREWGEIGASDSVYQMSSFGHSSPLDRPSNGTTEVPWIMCSHF